MRDFNQWMNNFTKSIANYQYYVDFEKVFKNVENKKVELNILNSLIGSPTIEEDFVRLVQKYPETLSCIPLLLAKREMEINAKDHDGSFCYHFDQMNYSVEQYGLFMQKTGLFDLLSNHIINNLVDYVLGVEVGLDSNGRKNRGGHLMEDIVESHLKSMGLERDLHYFKEMSLSEIENKWGIDLSLISNNGTTEKRFDFVIKTSACVYGLETNFYTSAGSKLNETARSYKTIALETQNLNYFKFIWITDGHGWFAARNNLLETFEVLEHLYCIADLEQGALLKLLDC